MTRQDREPRRNSPVVNRRAVIRGAIGLGLATAAGGTIILAGHKTDVPQPVTTPDKKPPVIPSPTIAPKPEAAKPQAATKPAAKSEPTLDRKPSAAELNYRENLLIVTQEVQKNPIAPRTQEEEQALWDNIPLSTETNKETA